MAVALLLISLTCAALAWWLAGQGAKQSAAAPIAALLVLLPSAACLWSLLHQDRQLGNARASLERDHEHTQAQQQSLKAVRRERDLLVAALDVLPIGLAVFDRRDRLVLSNEFLQRLSPGVAPVLDQQSGLPALMQHELNYDIRPYGASNARSSHSNRSDSLLLKYPGERWVQSLVARGEHGVTAVARADVTELVRAQHLTELANERLLRQSATDGLTGIPNRRAFDDTLRVEWLRAARGGGCLSLLVVDIDHFKRFNDHYGHVAGDECLRQVAALLQSCVRRAGEIVARYGGEEFVVLLPATEIAQAEEMAQRCLMEIAHLAIPHASSPTASHVTFSIGIAHVHPSASHEPELLVNAADTAMYRAKSAGRACYAVADLADWEIEKDAPRSGPGELN